MIVDVVRKLTGKCLGFFGCDPGRSAHKIDDETRRSGFVKQHQAAANYA